LDVVTQLSLLLPKYTDKVSDVLSISSIVVSSNIATITTSSAHGITTGQAITLANVEIKTPITARSQDGTLFTFTVSPAHDLTFNWSDHDNITLSGFTNPNWNGSFELKDVPNRFTFIVQSSESIPALNGNEVLHEVRNDGINGRFYATRISATVFTISGTFLDGTYTGGTVNKGIRIAGSITIERALDQYTEENLTDLWMFVVMNDAETSKSRHAFSDATATKATGDDMRLRLIDGFTITIVINTSDDIHATDAIDICRHDLLLPILKSVYGALFDTGLSNDPEFKAVATGHGFREYTKAILAYTYEFEFPMDLTIDDAVNEGDTRAFRDIDFTQEQGGDDTTDMTVVPINLDDSP
jgi:hypothetical protein